MQPDIRKVQRLLGVNPDGKWGPISEEALNKALGEQDGFDGSSQIPDGYFEMLAHIESGNRPYVKASTSSASGLFQFVKKTWVGEGGAWGDISDAAFGGLKPDVKEQKDRALSFTQKNADALAQAGVQVNSASLYAAHFLGAGVAIKALRGAPTDAISQHVDVAAISANQSILGGGKKVSDFISWLAKKTGVLAK